jgi:hypothetical protein
MVASYHGYGFSQSLAIIGTILNTAFDISISLGCWEVVIAELRYLLVLECRSMLTALKGSSNHQLRMLPS